jgi:hypothetical protein
VEPGEALRLRGGLVQERIEARGIIAQEALHPREEVLARLRGERAHRLVAEDRLEHLLAQRRRAARDDDLGAGETAGMGEDGEHDGEAGTVDAKRRETRSRSLRGAFLSDEIEDDALPLSYLGLGGRLELHGGAVETRGLGEECLPGEALAPGACRPLGGALGRGADDGLDAVLDRFAQLAVVGRLSGEHAPEPVARPADARLEGPHRVSGADHLVPASQHFPAEKRAASQSRLHLLPRRGVRGVHLRAKLGCGRELLDHGMLDNGCTSRKAREGAAERPAHESRARLCIGSEIVEPSADGRKCRRGDQVLDKGYLGHDKHLRLRQALLLEHLPQVRGHLAAGVLRYAVENEGESRPAIAGRTEEFPRYCVGIACGGRDEEPSVCRSEELVGERAVLGEDRVDVR